MRKVLLIAFHFPPVRTSSGIQRTLSMARYLSENGWQPIVLSISPKAYKITDDGQLKDIPDGVKVIRSFGLDAARHISIKGRYPKILALPDRWASWFPAGFVTGMNLIRKEKPDLIWSTYPIATAHLIGLAIARISGLPWVADFRDSMTEAHYPSDSTRRKVFRWLEKKVVGRAKRIIFTTPSTKKIYEDRYPESEENLFKVIPNGFDEEIFQSAEERAESAISDKSDTPIRLLHSGVLYPSERDPTQFFDAVAQLKANNSIDSAKLNIILRATGHDALYQPMLKERGIEDIVLLEPPVGYEEALSEMMDVDGLLLFQAANCNHQIPAKVYEYFRSGKPIVALTDAVGDTAAIIREAGVSSIFALDDREAIKSALMRFLEEPEFRREISVSPDRAQKYSRRSLVKAYSEILDDVC